MTVKQKKRLAAIAKRLKLEPQSGKARTLKEVVEIGGLLREARRLLPRGEWIGWLGENFGLNPRTAQTWMRLHRADVKIDDRPWGKVARELGKPEVI